MLAAIFALRLIVLVASSIYALEQSGTCEYSNGRICASCPAGFHCPVTPQNKMLKIPCDAGHYCRNGERNPCPAGSYGVQQYLTVENCNGKCLPGYFCPPGSNRNRQHACGGRHVFCPGGAKYPHTVSSGFYSYNSSLIEKEEADAGMTMSWERQCEVGYYCVDGIKHECPPGHFGHLAGSKSSSECVPCRRGFYCPSVEDNPTKVGEQIPCGSMQHFCPDQSAVTSPVSIGYYSVGGEGYNSSLFRTHQKICPIGSYCENGERQYCPVGTYGESRGLSSKTCSGFCPQGHYCEKGAIAPTGCKDNSYSAEGWSKCVPCSSKLNEGQERCKTDRNCCNL